MTLAPNPRQRLSGNEHFRRCRVIVSILVFLLALVACSGDNGGQNPEPSPTETALSGPAMLRVMVARASVFALPHRNAEVVYNLVEGDTVAVLGRSEPDELNTVFYLIQIGEQPGWVAASQVELLPSAEELRVVQAPTLTREAPTELPVTPIYDAVARITVSTTILSRPGFDGTPLKAAEPGDEFVIVARTPPNVDGVVFYGVRIETGIGWLPDTEVEVIGEALAVEVVVTETPTLGPSTVIADVAGSPTPTSGLPSLMPALTATLPGGAMAQVVVAEAPVLDFPDADASVLLMATEGQTFNLVAVTPINAEGIVYYGIQLETGTGWLQGAMVDVSGDLSAVRVVLTSTPAASPTVTPFVVAPEVTTTPMPSPTATVADATDVATPAPTIGTPSVRYAEPPLLTLDLPAEWDEGHFLIPITSAFVEGHIILSVYEGPLMEGADGHIWVVWRFPNILPYGAESVDLWADAILYLRSMLFLDCNILVDTEGRTTYTIGGQEAVGTIFSAVDCPGEAEDVAGWFAGLQYEGENYIFYMGVEPASLVTEGIPYLRQIVNSITFISVE